MITPEQGAEAGGQEPTVRRQSAADQTVPRLAADQVAATVWVPATPREVTELFAEVAAPWWLAGGYALELAAGRSWREHGDIDVLVLRRDQLVVQDALAGWEWWAADPPGALRAWRDGEVLPSSVHDIWCRPGPDQPWQIQVMLDESADADWVSRRNPGVRRPIGALGLERGGVPYLAPEVQLFYKAKNVRPKDQRDFAEVAPLLSEGQRSGLREALAATYGGHPWLGEL